MKYSRKVDSNQTEIIDALRLVGAKVCIIGEPVDLLVGFRGNLMAMEIKNPKGRNRATEQQVKFFKEFAGCPISYVDGVDAALRHLKIINAKEVHAITAKEVAAERERCAALCDNLRLITDDDIGATNALLWAAEAIRDNAGNEGR